MVSRALMFSTARRRNGFAGIHDLWSGTRVVHRAKEGRRPALEPTPELAIGAAASPRRLGPFDVIGTVGRTETGTLLLGFDASLRRRVWLHELPLGAPKVSPLIRDLDRPGRVRWLGERRTSTERWDAYEALGGMPLVTLLGRPQPWHAVRLWLADLAREIDAALNDGSLGQLSLDRVWITREGRAKLLDFRAPGAPDISTRTVLLSQQSAQSFLSDVATSALTGRLRGPTESGRRPQHALPVSASTLLNALDRGRLGKWSEVVDRTTALVKGTDRVDRRRRAATIALCAAMPLTMVLFGVGMASLTRGTPGGRSDEIVDLSIILSTLTMGYDKDFKGPAAETYIAGRYGSILTDPQLWADPVAVVPLIPHRQLIERIVAAHPRVSPEEMAAARAELGGYPERIASVRRSSQSTSSWSVALVTGPFMFLIEALGGVASAWLFRGGLLLRAFGIEVVTKTDEPVSRMRALWRGLLAWGPVIIAPVLFVPNPISLYVGFAQVVVAGMCAVTMFVVGAVWAVVHPERGLQDRIAGTYLVPR